MLAPFFLQTLLCGAELRSLFSLLPPAWKYPTGLEEDKNRSIQWKHKRALQKVP